MLPTYINATHTNNPDIAYVIGQLTMVTMMFIAGLNLILLILSLYWLNNKTYKAIKTFSKGIFSIAVISIVVSVFSIALIHQNNQRSFKVNYHVFNVKSSERYVSGNKTNIVYHLKTSKNQTVKTIVAPENYFTDTKHITVKSYKYVSNKLTGQVKTQYSVIAWDNINIKY